MGNDYKKNIKYNLLVSIPTAVVTALLTSIIVYTQTSSQQWFEKTQRKIALEEKKLNEKIELSRSIMILINEVSFLRQYAALNNFVVNLSFEFKDEYQEHIQNIFAESLKKFYESQIKYVDKLTQLHSSLIEPKYFFGEKVHKSIDGFMNYIDKYRTIPTISVEEIKKRRLAARDKSLLSDIKIISSLFQDINLFIKDDEYNSFGKTVMVAMYDEILFQINSENINYCK